MEASSSTIHLYSYAKVVYRDGRWAQLDSCRRRHRFVHSVRCCLLLRPIWPPKVRPVHMVAHERRVRRQVTTFCSHIISQFVSSDASIISKKNTVTQSESQWIQQIRTRTGMPRPPKSDEKQPRMCLWIIRSISNCTIWHFIINNILLFILPTNWWIQYCGGDRRQCASPLPLAGRSTHTLAITYRCLAMAVNRIFNKFLLTLVSCARDIYIKNVWYAHAHACEPAYDWEYIV